ncbi:MAG: RluA family pseudouridine synthase [Fervidobacterium sp.]|nr:RluA family pseudouridine synthase [Fervidobacterium sp.]
MVNNVKQTNVLGHVFEWHVDESNYFSRIDKFLRKVLKNVPLSAIYKLFRTGKVHLNGQKVKDPSTKLTLGDLVQIMGEDINKYNREYKELKPVKMKLDIIYEDETLLVINKPAHLSVHPGKNINKPSLIEGLKYYGEKAGFEAFLVHRLDKDTSGVMVIAKDRNIARQISEIISSRNVEKKYMALVFGKVQKLVIEEPIDNQYAKTILTPVRYFKIHLDGENVELSLVDVDIETGRKHQIRKHLSLKGFPIVCDKNYGDFKLNRLFAKKYKLQRHFLHCTQIRFNFRGKEYNFIADLSGELKNVLQLLELESGKI